MAQVLCDVPDPRSVAFRGPLEELRRICGVKNVLPKACTLSYSLLGCVYGGTFNSSKVRIRRVRMRSNGDLKKFKEVCISMTCSSAPRRSRVPQTFHQVAVFWKHLTHPNIVPLLGATIDPPQLISDQMPGGDLTDYIATHLETDRISLVNDLPASLCETLNLSSVV